MITEEQTMEALRAGHDVDRLCGVFLSYNYAWSEPQQMTALIREDYIARLNELSIALEKLKNFTQDELARALTIRDYENSRAKS